MSSTTPPFSFCLQALSVLASLRASLCLPLAAISVSAAEAQVAVAPLPDSITNGGIAFAANGYDGSLKQEHLHYVIGGKSIRRVVCERGVPTDNWVCVRQELSVPFYVTGVDAIQGGDVVFVAGMETDGTPVLEKWNFTTRVSGWAASASNYLPGAPQPGVAVPGPQITFGPQGGGPWTPRDPAQPLDAPNRRVVPIGGVGVLASLAVDPQGRYLFAIDHEANSVVQLTIPSAGGPPVVSTLLTAANSPGIGELWSVQVCEFAPEGRKLLITGYKEIDATVSGMTFTVVPDSDNDGVFELHNAPATIFSEELFAASIYGNGGSWDFFFIE